MQMKPTLEGAGLSEKTKYRSQSLLTPIVLLLQEKLIHKNEVIAELMEENVRVKKANGDL